MGRSKIEWLKDPVSGKDGYTINPVKGLCPVDCKDNQGKSYCYARKLYRRFKWNPELDFDASVFNDLPKMKPGSKIFWGSTFELFWEGEAVMARWMRFVFEAVRRHPELTHIFLTKQPQNLIKWSPFPPNVWVGVSVDGTDNAPLGRMLYTGFDKISSKTVKFISFEPLLAETKLDPRDLGWAGISWLIIGSQTQPVKHPPREWVDEIITAADKAKIPVFVKEPLASHYNIRRKEFPKIG